jgi:hypothetical protein
MKKSILLLTAAILSTSLNVQAESCTSNSCQTKSSKTFQRDLENLTSLMTQMEIRTFLVNGRTLRLEATTEQFFKRENGLLLLSEEGEKRLDAINAVYGRFPKSEMRIEVYTSNVGVGELNAKNYTNQQAKMLSIGFFDNLRTIPKFAGKGLLSLERCENGNFHCNNRVVFFIENIK